MKLKKESLRKLHAAAEKQDQDYLLRFLKDKHAVDISELLDNFDTEASRYVIQLLDKQLASDIISNLESDVRQEFLRTFTSQELADIIDYTDSDDAADILNEQPVKVREGVTALMNNKEKASNVVDLLHYEEDCAGGLMAKEMIVVGHDWTVKECIAEIRRQKETVGKVLSVYVVDKKKKFKGRISLKSLLLSEKKDLVSTLIIKDVESVQTYDSADEVVDLMRKYDLESVPVLNIQKELMGRITIDDVMDYMTEQADVEQQVMSGISENIEEDDSVWMLSRARLPWLIIGMAGGLLGAQFLSLFETELSLIPAMAFFIPLITATGGNVGIQSSTIVVQAITGASEVNPSTLWDRLSKALVVAVLNGIVITAIVFGFNVMLGSSTNLSIVVSSALFCVVILASFMGTVTPMVLQRVGINPALASGPFITTANDLIGLGVYFIVAKLLFETI